MDMVTGMVTGMVTDMVTDMEANVEDMASVAVTTATEDTMGSDIVAPGFHHSERVTMDITKASLQTQM